jgi:hypothetical protein
VLGERPVSLSRIENHLNERKLVAFGLLLLRCSEPRDAPKPHPAG